MVEPVVIGDATLYLGDASAILPTLPKADACVTDPPYGIGEAAGKNASRGNLAAATDYGNDDWDDAPISPELLASVLNSARWHIIFGGNYYALPAATCWLVWDKENGANDFADCELAWTNMPKAVRRLRWMWNGMLRKGNEPRVGHPTQKPLGVMEWCLDQLPAGTRTILDPFMGSGTTGVACVKRGLAFVGVEQRAPYFDIACKRIEEAYRQPRLFEEPKPKAEQIDLLAGDAA